jgi:hypothetical protein
MPIDPIKIILQCTGPRASRRDLADYLVMYEYDIKKPVSPGKKRRAQGARPSIQTHLGICSHLKRSTVSIGSEAAVEFHPGPLAWLLIRRIAIRTGL